MKRMLLISEKLLQKRIRELAAQITADYAGKELTLICVLKGAMYFFTDLSRRIKLDTQVEIMRAASYEGENSTGVVEIKVELDKPVTGKDVIVVEDIIDTGKTLSYILQDLKSQNPNSVKLCALLDKPKRRILECDVPVDYKGFVISDYFVIGYGLDLDQKYRNLPAVYCFARTKEEELAIKEEHKLLQKQV